MVIDGMVENNPDLNIFIQRIQDIYSLHYKWIFGLHQADIIAHTCCSCSTAHIQTCPSQTIHTHTCCSSVAGMRGAAPCWRRRVWANGCSPASCTLAWYSLLLRVCENECSLVGAFTLVARARSNPSLNDNARLWPVAVRDWCAVVRLGFGSWESFDFSLGIAWSWGAGVWLRTWLSGNNWVCGTVSCTPCCMVTAGCTKGDGVKPWCCGTVCDIPWYWGTVCNTLWDSGAVCNTLWDSGTVGGFPPIWPFCTRLWCGEADAPCVCTRGKDIVWECVLPCGKLNGTWRLCGVWEPLPRVAMTCLSSACETPTRGSLCVCRCRDGDGWLGGVLLVLDACTAGIFRLMVVR